MIGKKELLIINHLRKNSRETLTNISKRTHIPISTIFEKIRVNEGDLIIKHTSLINFFKLGFNARAKIILKSKKESKSELKRYLLLNQNVNTLYKINNGFDYMIECIFRNMKELEDFLEIVDDKFGLEKKEIFYIIDDLKRESFLSDPEIAPLGA